MNISGYKFIALTCQYVSYLPWGGSMRVDRLEGAPSLPPFLRRWRLFWFLVSVVYCVVFICMRLVFLFWCVFCWLSDVSVLVPCLFSWAGRFVAVDFGGIGCDSVAVVTAVGGDGRFTAVDFGGIGGDIKPVVTAIGVDDDGDTTTGAALFSTAARWPHLS